MKMIVLAALSIQLFGQAPVSITDLSFETKTNGVYIRVHADQDINPDWVTGWQNGDRFYITIHHARGDTAHIKSLKTGPYIKSISSTHVGQSLQLTFKLTRTVDQYEFFFRENPSELFVSLRFPVSDLVASLKSENKHRNNGRDINSIDTSASPFIKALYFFGAGLVAAGYFAKDNNRNWEITAGMGVIAAAYVYNQFINPGRK
ncbi:MAG: hypothetical protein V3S48_03855 [Candidatus Neomarinimicrobiota bacterium]